MNRDLNYKPKSELIARIPADGFLVDIVFILTAISLHQLRFFVKENIVWFFAVVGLLQGITVYTVKLGWDFSKTTEINVPGSISAMFGLVFILAIGGFFWLFLPASAFDTPTMWTLTTINIFVALFGSIIGFAITLDKEPGVKLSITNKMLILFVPALYLSISEILIYISAQSENIGLGISILAICISYLPIRLILIAKPPYNKFEILTAIFAFSYFIYTLF